jgi:hypothetical protein
VENHASGVDYSPGVFTPRLAGVAQHQLDQRVIVPQRLSFKRQSPRCVQFSPHQSGHGRPRVRAGEGSKPDVIEQGVHRREGAEVLHYHCLFRLLSFWLQQLQQITGRKMVRNRLRR